jgi:CRP-like cAMP-binding protein
VALRRDAKVESMARVPLFAQCSRGELRRIAARADEIDLPEGRVLTREDEPGREFFVLLEGEVEVRRRSRKLGILGPGEFVGEIALVSKVPRTATVVARTPLRALVLTERDFRALMRDAPGIQLKVLQALADRVAESERQ